MTKLAIQVSKITIGSERRSLAPYVVACAVAQNAAIFPDREISEPRCGEASAAGKVGLRLYDGEPGEWLALYVGVFDTDHRATRARGVVVPLFTNFCDTKTRLPAEEGGVVFGSRGTALLAVRRLMEPFGRALTMGRSVPSGEDDEEGKTRRVQDICLFEKCLIVEAGANLPILVEGDSASFVISKAPKPKAAAEEPATEGSKDNTASE